ncbi:hypothetical protein K474DRAFT_1190407 [Panus rudis PR-1116 ss-1]|nr:hypothetical protein K474DRAFT_1190407 [Panus rudis PR-1116 ss-1]
MADSVAPPSQVVPGQTPVQPTADLVLEQLRATNAELQRRKAEAEKDLELFRDMYGKASAHVSEVTKENNQLHDRVTLLESQVKEGIVMIRGTYEDRIRRLEEEVAKWKGLYEIIAARDAKMQGDDLRKRAAVAEELSVENERLRDELETLQADYEKAEKALEELGERELNELGEEEKALQEAVEHAGGIEPPLQPVLAA